MQTDENEKISYSHKPISNQYKNGYIPDKYNHKVKMPLAYKMMCIILYILNNIPEKNTEIRNIKISELRPTREGYYIKLNKVGKTYRCININKFGHWETQPNVNSMKVLGNYISSQMIKVFDESLKIVKYNQEEIRKKARNMKKDSGLGVETVWRITKIKQILSKQFEVMGEMDIMHGKQIMIQEKNDIARICYLNLYNRGTYYIHGDESFQSCINYIIHENLSEILGLGKQI